MKNIIKLSRHEIIYISGGKKVTQTRVQGHAPDSFLWRYRKSLTFAGLTLVPALLCPLVELKHSNKSLEFSNYINELKYAIIVVVLSGVIAYVGVGAYTKIIGGKTNG